MSPSPPGSISSAPGARQGHRLTAALPWVMVAMSAAMALLPTLSACMWSAEGTLLLYLALFAPYLWLVQQGQPSVGSMGVLLAALAMRGVFLPAEPLLSDDIYRYVWDGRVALSGINPFVHAPASEALAHLRDPQIWPRINHPDVPTVYPPVAQALFALNAAAGFGVMGLKGLLLGAEALCLALAAAIVRSGPRPWAPERQTRALIIYALNPLVAVETAWSGHIDTLAWGLLAVGLVAVEQARSHQPPDHTQRAAALALAGGLALGLSIAAKFLTLLALPLLLLPRDLAPAETWPQCVRKLLHGMVPVLVAVTVAVAAFAPYRDAGPALFAGLGRYAKSWRSNDALFALATRAAQYNITHLAQDAPGTAAGVSEGPVLIRMSRLDELYEKLGWTRHWEGQRIADTTRTPEQLAQTIAKALAVLAVLMALAWAAWLGLGPAQGTSMALMALFFTAPTVHPWYVAWLVPLAALYLGDAKPARTPWPPATLAFSGTVVLAYSAWLSARHGGPWQVPWPVLILEYGAVVLCLIMRETRALRPPVDTQTPAMPEHPSP